MYILRVITKEGFVLLSTRLIDKEEKERQEEYYKVLGYTVEERRF